jgi:hypothetical protein
MKSKSTLPIFKIIAFNEKGERILREVKGQIIYRKEFVAFSHRVYSQENKFIGWAVSEERTGRKIIPIKRTKAIAITVALGCLDTSLQIIKNELDSLPDKEAWLK